MSAAPLPRGVEHLGDDRYTIRIAVSTGSTKSVQRTVRGTAQEVLALYHAAVAARKQGNDPIAVLDAWTDGSTPSPKAQRPAAPAPAARPVRTFAELFAVYLEERQRIVATSDHTFRQNRHKRGMTLRPTSLKSETERIERAVIPVLGTRRIDELTAEVMQAWLIGLAEAGQSVGTARALLVNVRAIVKRAKRSELPEDFPWQTVHPVPPSTPTKRAIEPSKWNGLPGSTKPALSFANGKALAQLMAAADRVVMYLEHFGGPRIGESYGLLLGDLTWDGQRLWATIERQMTPDGERVPWVKSDASYRRIPLADILAEYLFSYCKRYHDYDLRNPDLARAHRPLVVNPAGRDFDGTFLPGVRSNFSSRLVAVRDASPFGHDELGYSIDSHHLRKSVASYLLNARSIIHAIERDDAGNEPDPADLVAHNAWLTRRLRRLSVLELGFSPMEISRYLGHEINSKTDTESASAVTLEYYNLTMGLQDGAKAIADVLDLIIRHEVQTLLDEPDPEDLLPVHFPGDPDWLTVAETKPLVGINQSNISVAVSDGRLEGHLGWLANGGYLRNKDAEKNSPALPMLFISRKSIDAWVALRNRPSMSELRAQLGMSERAIHRNFIETGRVRAELVGRRCYLDAGDVSSLTATLFNAVEATVRDAGPLTLRRLTERFNNRHGHLFCEGSALETWVAHWVGVLIERGRLQRRLDGRIACPPASTTSSAPDTAA